jgi:hypothetical protein
VVRFVLAVFVALVGLWASPAGAHTRSQSFSTWTIGENTLEGVYQVDAYRATQLSETPQDLHTLLRDHLAKTISLSQNGKPCTAAPLRAAGAPRGDLRVELRFTCPQPFAQSPARLVVGAFFGVSLSHVHYVRTTDAAGRFAEAILAQGRTAVPIGGTAGEPASNFLDFLILGFEHVLSGVDHVAFLIALALLAGGLWRLLIAVTGFTLGHSLTLGLVALGVLKPDTSAIEALIGFTVAWAAGDALARTRNMPPWLGVAGAVAMMAIPALAWVLGLPVLSWLVLAGVALFAASMSFARRFDAPRVAPVIATVFGLAHGAGFAGPLLDMEIAPESLLWTLLAFNLGVEAGQLTALAVMGAALWALRNAVPRLPSQAYDATATLLFALGTFWFVSRALA